MKNDDATDVDARASSREEAGAGPRLVLAWGGGSAVRAVAPGEALVVGRGDDADLRVDHRSVSRRHARIEVGPPFTVTDLGSVNGTWVAGKRIPANEPAIVPLGMLVEVGSVLVSFHQASAPERAAPPRGVVVVDPKMVEIYRQLDLVAKSHLNVLLLGESGVGKEIAASRVHEESLRAEAPLVKVNCASLVDTLIEAELFGYERGAFTGAVQSKAGLLEAASGGTFFLDEVGELPAATQAKLLRVIESGEVQRVGGLKPRPIDVRFVSATNRDLRKLVTEGRFREDLFFRLDGFSIRIPPIRERIDELPALVTAFVADACARSGRAPLAVREDAMARLLSYPWPGNVRELRNVVARSVVLCAGPTLEGQHLRFDTTATAGATPSSPPAAESERDRVLRALAEAGGNQKRAAAALGISLRTLQNRLDALQIPRPRKG